MGVAHIVIIVVLAMIGAVLFMAGWLCWLAISLITRLIAFENAPTLNEQKAARKTQIEVEDDEEDWD